jgi:hypothetical protein
MGKTWPLLEDLEPGVVYQIANDPFSVVKPSALFRTVQIG